MVTSLCIIPLNRFVVSCIPSWFWGPMVTLEDCLAAFFAADELKGKQYYTVLFYCNTLVFIWTVLGISYTWLSLTVTKFVKYLQCVFFTQHARPDWPSKQRTEKLGLQHTQRECDFILCSGCHYSTISLHRKLLFTEYQVPL